MAGVKRKYIAQTGINFDGRKGKRRFEAGEELPGDIDQAEIEDLIELGAIKAKEESEA